MPDPLDGLNPQQREAVLHQDGPLCVFAGPGSGKTRVLTCRIARLIHQSGVKPENIMVLTFTRRAADELKRRLIDLVGTYGVYVNTFYAFCGEKLSEDFDFTIAKKDKQNNLIQNLPAADTTSAKFSEKIRLKIENYKLASNASRLDIADSAWLRDWYRPYQAALNEAENAGLLRSSRQNDPAV